MSRQEKETRTCISCKSKKNKSELIRIVKNQDGIILVDSCGRISGRGIYVCKNTSCANLCKAKHLIEKAFRCPIRSDVYDNIK